MSHKNNKWLWIFLVNEDQRLSLGARSLYLRIFSFSNMKRGCFASNGRFAKEYEKDVSTISRWIGELVEYGYIESRIDQSMGNRRHLKPIPPPFIVKKTTGTDAKTPIRIDEDTLTQEEEDAIDPVALSSGHEQEKDVLNDAIQSKEEMSKEQIAKERRATKKEQPVVVCNNLEKDDAEKPNTDSHTFDEADTFDGAYSAMVEGLLFSGQKLSAMTPDDQATIIIAFSRQLRDKITDPSFQRDKLMGYMSKHGVRPESVMHGLWNLKIGNFGYALESRLNYLLSRQVKKMKDRLSHAVDDFREGAEWYLTDDLKEIAKPFSDLLNIPLTGIESSKSP